MLTDLQCKKAKPGDRARRLTDGQGLYLEVRPSGAKTFKYRFRVGGKASVYSLGDYVVAPMGETAEAAQARRDGGSLTLAEAREELGRAKALVKQGINPAHHREMERLKRQQENAVTFEAVAKEWLALRDWEEITRSKRQRMLERLVFPKIGGLPVRAIAPAHVLKILTAIAKKNGRSVAAEARRTMSGVFELAVATLRADMDPVHPVRKMIPANKTQHKRALDPADIGQLLSDVQEHGGRQETIAAFRLMWWTLCRPTEAAEAQWSEFDLDKALWTIPAERMKRRREHTVPLPLQALAMLRAMREVTGRWDHVFPGRDDRRLPMTAATFRQMLRALGWSGRFSPHAARTTGSTRLHELGYPSDWVERQLAHLQADSVRRSYDHSQFLAPRGAMMQRWADLLDSWARGEETDNVVPLHQGHAAAG